MEWWIVLFTELKKTDIWTEILETGLVISNVIPLHSTPLHSLYLVLLKQVFF